MNACELECQNGGQCSEVVDEDGFSKLLLTTKFNGQYCNCPIGYAGPVCQFPIDVCGKGEHICLHGAKCLRENGAPSGYRCECNEQNDTGNCQKHTTEFCYPTEGHVEYFGGMAVAAFCVNDGKCSDIELDGFIFPQCICPSPFTGPHCEFLELNQLIQTKGSTSNPEAETSGLSRGGLALLILFLVTSSVVATGFAVRQLRRHYRNKDGSVVNIQGFRDEADVSEIAMSPNGSMLFPAFSPSDSFHSSGGRKRSKRNKLSRNRSGRFT